MNEIYTPRDKSSTTRNMKESIGVMGILFKGNISYNIVPQIAFFADFGVGLYSGKINYDRNWTGKYEFYDYDWYVHPNGYWAYGWHKYEYGNWKSSDNIEISKYKIGFTGGFRVELSLIESLSFFIEAKARYLKLKEVKAKETYDYLENWKECGYYYGYDDLRYWYSYSDSDSWSSEDTLYLYDNYSKTLKKTYTYVTANRYVYSGTDYSNFRHARVDLSGFNILFGIRIKLF